MLRQPRRQLRRECGPLQSQHVRVLLLVPEVFSRAEQDAGVRIGSRYARSRVRDPAPRSSVRRAAAAVAIPVRWIGTEVLRAESQPLSTQRDGGFDRVFELSQFPPRKFGKAPERLRCHLLHLDLLQPAKIFSTRWWASAGISDAAPAKVACGSAPHSNGSRDPGNSLPSTRLASSRFEAAELADRT